MIQPSAFRRGPSSSSSVKLPPGMWWGSVPAHLSEGPAPEQSDCRVLLAFNGLGVVNIGVQGAQYQGAGEVHPGVRLR